MNPERWESAKRLFHDALERPLDERSDFLADAAKDDPALADEVRALLGASQCADDLFGDVAQPSAGATLPAGTRIGPYLLIAEIGEGGMGTVYVAERDDVYRKRVAIKVIRGGGHYGAFVEKFRQERQILANLEHPNIVRLLDGGTTGDGLPYFVMEHVTGVPIDVYCDAHQLGIAERLTLFRTVCGAVDYAHDNLVVHRDLKPSNILVDADGTPKLLDFGIAKMIAPAVGAESGSAATLLPMLTPGYASPEQIRGEPVTTASEVYALGVVLYVLLTGRPPFVVHTGSLEEIVRSVCETPPLAPSEMVGHTFAGGTRPPATRAELRGDLDTILLKALHKDASCRYRSAQALSDDLERHLRGLPVLARGDTVRYRSSKFVGRHRAAVAAAVLVVAGLVAGMIMTVSRARIADANRLRAERRFDDARQLANFVMFDMHDAIVKLPGATAVRKQLVEKALTYLDRLASDHVTDPILLADLGRGYDRLGRVQGHPSWANLGDHAGALASMGKAVAIREQLRDASPRDPVRLAELAESYGALGRILSRQGETAGAHAALEQMKAALDTVRLGSADDTPVLDAWQVYYGSLAAEQDAAHDFNVLRDTRRRQVYVAEKLFVRDTSSLDRQRGLALAYKYYGRALHALGEWALAAELYDKALAMDRQVVDAAASNPHYRLDLAFGYSLKGTLLSDEGDLDAALDAARHALQLGQEVYASDVGNEFAFERLIDAHRLLAVVFARKGEPASAVAHTRQVLKLREQWEAKHPSASTTR